jgi:hypothetical protein
MSSDLKATTDRAGFSQDVTARPIAVHFFLLAFYAIAKWQNIKSGLL